MQQDQEQSELTRGRQGVQALEVGFSVLKALSSRSHPMLLKDIAELSDLSTAKALRYLVSLMHLGLVEQDRGTARYSLGPAAMQIGLAYMASRNPIHLAGPVLETLCERIQETVALAVWGTHGATIVRIVDAGSPVTVTLRLGTVLPLSNSATGRAFLAFHRSPYLRKCLDDELQAQSTQKKIPINTLRRQLERQLNEIRQKGLSRATGSLTPGINGFSAPVFDHSGSMVAAMTSLGAVGEFDAAWDSPLARAMLESTQIFSRQLGYTA